MNSTPAEFKALAKALGASLARSGHPVPHTALLNAVASASNKRNWNTLKAALSGSPAESRLPPPAEPNLVEYTKGTWFWLQLTYALGHDVPPSWSFSEADVRTWCLKRIGQVVFGVLRWEGWNLPAELNLKTCTLDAGEFAPDSKGIARAQFDVKLPVRGSFSFEVSHTERTGWILDAMGAEKAFKKMEEIVPRTELLALGVSARACAVPAELSTDDDAMTVAFDAAPFLKSATPAQILAILEKEGRDSEATDAIADWEQQHGPCSKAVQEVQDYLVALQRNPRCTVGFGCKVSPLAVVRWLQANRLETLAEVLCNYFEVTLLECDEDELAGRWDWFCGDDACPTSYESMEEAATAAMQALSLISRAEKAFGTGM